ncbi:hypothetical protein [Bacillus thuringiensis]|uniref:Pycsar effector protein domain-containing protein n=1 Tax=Bacillus thuringiensis subsp. jegathesan TaxID=56955 RepID=A0A9X6R1H1_BACTJ|nr:hypothetical protein [Bacillus thuringiensis]OUB71865.1 hypothetical protein BK750_09830 [Bacillus thuringiensis serovar jegathesan]
MGEEREESFIDGSCDVILDTAKAVYDEEIDRFKQTEAKTNITLAFVGVLFGAYLTYLSAFKLPIKEISYLVYTVLFKAAVFTCYITSIFYFLKAINTGKYEQVNLDEVASESYAKQDAEITKLRIAFSYRDIVSRNRDVLERKLKSYRIGLYIMTCGFIAFAIHFLIEEVIRHVG